MLRPGLVSQNLATILICHLEKRWQAEGTFMLGRRQKAPAVVKTIRCVMLLLMITISRCKSQASNAAAANERACPRWLHLESGWSMVWATTSPFQRMWSHLDFDMVTPNWPWNSSFWTQPLHRHNFLLHLFNAGRNIPQALLLEVLSLQSLELRLSLLRQLQVTRAVPKSTTLRPPVPQCEPPALSQRPAGGFVDCEMP